MNGRRPWLERLWYPNADRDLSHALVTPALALASLGFRIGAAARGGARPPPLNGVRVVSVGNLTVGGAGKTPAVIFLAQLALEHGRRVGVLSRGWGRNSTGALAFDAAMLPSAEESGDEPRLIAQRCPGVRVFVGGDRTALAQTARSDGCQLLLLDDGFQQRQLGCDAELVVVDDEVLFGNGHLLPWGPLRESPGTLARATVVWRRLAGDGSPRAPLHPREVHARYGARPLSELSGRPALVLAGTARPSTVVASAARAGVKVVATRFFRDHHRFTPEELAEVEHAARALSATVVTTEKDLQRLPVGFAAVPLVLDVELVDGHEQLLTVLGLEGAKRA